MANALQPALTTLDRVLSERELPDELGSCDRFFAHHLSNCARCSIPTAFDVICIEICQRIVSALEAM